MQEQKGAPHSGRAFRSVEKSEDYGRFELVLPFVLPGRLMFPFMLVAPLFALAFALVLPPAFEFMFEFVVFEFDMFALAFVMFEFDVFVFAFAFDMFEFAFAFAFMFPLALLVFSAGEHAVHTLSTARRVRSAKVLRI